MNVVAEDIDLKTTSFYQILNAVHLPGELKVTINGKERPNAYGVGASMSKMATRSVALNFGGKHESCGNTEKEVKLPRGEGTTVILFAEVERDQNGEITSSPISLASVSLPVRGREAEAGSLTLVSLSERPSVTLELKGESVTLLRKTPVTKVLGRGGYSLSVGSRVVVSGEMELPGHALVILYDQKDGVRVTLFE